MMSSAEETGTKTEHTIQKPEIKLALLSMLGVMFIATFAYFNFLKYQPKSLTQVAEVQGIGDEKTSQIEVNIPYPENHEILGVSKTARIEQHTFKTSDTPENVQTFYKNVLKSQNWELTNEARMENTLSTEYKKAKARIKISTAPDSNNKSTIVSIEVNQRN